jgi:hypothetical protein
MEEEDMGGKSNAAAAGASSQCTEPSARVASAYTLLAEKVARLFEERAEDGLSDTLAGKDMDEVMGFISKYGVPWEWICSLLCASFASPGGEHGKLTFN